MDISSQRVLPPSPDRILKQLQAYRGAAALNSAIELDLFTRIAHGRNTASRLASELGAPLHGVECLCDFLVEEGYLIRNGGELSMAEDAASFLDRGSPAFLTTELETAQSPALLNCFRRLTECVRQGGAAKGKGADGTDRAHANALAEVVDLPADVPLKILDLAGGRGLVGIALARRYPQAIIVMADTSQAVRRAQVNADRANLSTRFQNIPGDPAGLASGPGFDAVVLATELYHRTPPQINSLLKKGRDALKKNGGRMYLFEFLADGSEEFTRDLVDWRLLLLATAKKGAPYWVAEITAMMTACGFQDIEARRVAGTPGTLITGSKV